MKKYLAGVVVFTAMAVPMAVFADNGQIIALYQQLIQLLQREIVMLQSKALVVAPTSGGAPLDVTFTLGEPQGNEAIDFGDGHSTGSGGCTTNAQGFCDLSKPVTHTYTLPGSYTVTLYRTVSTKAAVVSTYKVSVK